jgi:hypothetical protein
MSLKVHGVDLFQFQAKLNQTFLNYKCCGCTVCFIYSVDVILNKILWRVTDVSE